MRRLSAAILCVALSMTVRIAAAEAASTSAQPARTPAAGAVDAQRMQSIASDPGDWLATGRDQQGTYYSPLARINSKNVARLGFAWQYDLGTRKKALGV
jgi:quinohemoprotein ethanol dehydrogenase